MPFEVDEIEEGITDQHTCFSDYHAINYLVINDAVVDQVIQTEMSYANHDTCRLIKKPGIIICIR